MFDLNYAGDIDGISDEARALFGRGVIITKCYKAMKGTHLKVQTRLDFDEAKDLTLWYIKERFGANHAMCNIADWMERGELLFTFTDFS